MTNEELSKTLVTAAQSTDNMALRLLLILASERIDSSTQPQQAEKQEPIAFVTGTYGGRFTVKPLNPAMVLSLNMALYTTPQPQHAEKQEPHSWYSAEHDEWMTNKTRKEHEALNSYTHKIGGFDLPLYTTPQPQREWVGLTDKERHKIREWQEIQEELGLVWAPMMLYLYEAIEAKLKEKNGQ